MSDGPEPTALAKAIRVPLGDHAGKAERVRVPVGNEAIPEPSGSIVNTFPVEVPEPTAPRQNAIFPF